MGLGAGMGRAIVDGRSPSWKHAHLSEDLTAGLRPQVQETLLSVLTPHLILPFLDEDLFCFVFVFFLNKMG